MGVKKFHKSNTLSRSKQFANKYLQELRTELTNFFLNQPQFQRFHWSASQMLSLQPGDQACPVPASQTAELVWRDGFRCRALPGHGSRAGLAVTVEVKRGQRTVLCLMFYCRGGFTCCWKRSTKRKVYVRMLPNWMAHRLDSGHAIPPVFLRWPAGVPALLLVQTVTSWY